MAMTATAFGDNNPIVDMNTTPLIDVLLVLLIMFIITLPLMTHSTTLQSGGTKDMKIPEVISLDIDFDGTMLWNGAIVGDMGQLESLVRNEAAKRDQPDFNVRPHDRAAYDTVARVLAVAQRNGIERISMGSIDN